MINMKPIIDDWNRADNNEEEEGGEEE